MGLNEERREERLPLVVGVSEEEELEGAWWARATLLVIGFLFGSLDVTMKLVLELKPVAPSPASACLVHAVLGTLAFVPTLSSSKSESSSKGWTATKLAFWTAASGALLYEGMKRTSVSRAALLMQLSVMATPVLERIALKRRQPLRIWVGAGLALVGVSFLASGGETTVASVAGDTMVLLGAILWAWYLVCMAALPIDNDANLLQATKWLVSTFFFAIWALLQHFCFGATLLEGWQRPAAWGLTVYAAIVPGALADVLQQKAQTKVRASEASLLLASEPLWAALLAAPFGEDHGPDVFFGGFFILGAIALSSGLFKCRPRHHITKPKPLHASPDHTKKKKNKTPSSSLDHPLVVLSSPPKDKVLASSPPVVEITTTTKKKKTPSSLS